MYLVRDRHRSSLRLAANPGESARGLSDSFLPREVLKERP